MEFDTKGLLTCSRYAFGPNRLHYCGPEKQTDLEEYLRTISTDSGLTAIISKFETLFPYLRLIASANNIKDPFDPGVVDAYWVGNRLLQNVRPQKLYAHLSDSLQVFRKSGKSADSLHLPISDMLPNHAYHVLNIFIRTGHHQTPQTVSTMDQCRISWGKIIAVSGMDAYIINRRPLLYDKNALRLGQPQQCAVCSVGGKYTIGDWVSVHWGYICDGITPLQVKNLMRMTQSAITIANTQHAV